MDNQKPPLNSIGVLLVAVGIIYAVPSLVAWAYHNTPENHWLRWLMPIRRALDEVVSLLNSLDSTLQLACMGTGLVIVGLFFIVATRFPKQPEGMNTL